VIAQDAMHDLVSSAASRANAPDPVRSRIGLELVEILVEMGERVFLDRGGERAKLPHSGMPCISRSRFCAGPKPLVMHLLGCGAAMSVRRLRPGRSAGCHGPSPRAVAAREGPQRFRAPSLIKAVAIADDGVGIVFRPHVGMQHGAEIVEPLADAHALAPFRIWRYG